MDFDEIWKSKEIKNVFLRILHKNDDGSIDVSFDFSHIFPKRVHKYQKWYLEQYYAPTGNKHSWTIDPSLRRI